ncbi:MAG: ribose-phosphate pyrophosphokinase [candidate division WOR-3 bacterium]|nr:ribose-phosphate pyrophosphokinase [candidate division WOR-3 bacterium]MCX7757525.1 ribose-phosphate pyrophosphokinase [candidate division WOR-3 bacterium]MDW7987182.1 ribose-phosphate pyrophosphokinase [candidate division WOR-3 bacterium]
MKGYNFKIFSGRANYPLAQRIVDYLGVSLGKLILQDFADKEIRVKIEENVRGVDAFVIQPTHPPAENLLELLLIIDALRRASAERITAVIPYYGYARQDRKDEPRVPISAKLIANLLVTSGASRILTMDLHAEQIQGFFDIPVDHLYAAPVLIEYFRKYDLSNLVIVAPDTGRANRARGFAKRLGDNIPIAVIDKRRPEQNRAEVISVVGDVENKNALILDDIIDTGNTLLAAVDALKQRGARNIIACATHAVFSKNCFEKLDASEISEIVITDTIKLPEEKKSKKITVLSVAALLGEAIRRIHLGESVSSLFI